MFKSTTTHTVGTDVYLDKIFKELLNNSFKDKGRCGIGATTLELNNASRCSLIVAPTIGILFDKKKSHPDLFIVYGEVSIEDIICQLSLKLPAQKIMVTPEGMPKVIEAAVQLTFLKEMQATWFLVLDEVHTYISEDYRKNILKPFDYFWDFQNKCVLSATPYYFSDKRFHDLHLHKINFTEKLGLVTILNAKSVFATLYYIISQSQGQKGNLHIFLNSVTEIAKVARWLDSQQIDFNVYCANDKDGENMKKLGDYQSHYVSQPATENYKAINFYTSRYFEGWDLFDEDATIILVTDVKIPHTKVPVAMKLKQAAGRLRETPVGRSTIIHITNNHNIQARTKTLREFELDCYDTANQYMSNQNAIVHSKSGDVSRVEDDPRLERVADVDPKTRLVTLNPNKIDQQINQAYCHETYNNINLIEEEWQNAYFDTAVFHRNDLLESKTQMKRKSKQQQLREDYLALKDFKKSGGYYFGLSIEDKLRSANPLAIKAVELLDEKTMEDLKYNPTKVKSAVILASNNLQQVKLLQLLNQQFQLTCKYSNETIKLKLQSIYNALDICDIKSGDVRIAKAADLGAMGWFDTEPCKLPDAKGKYTVHGHQIIRSSFSVRIAA